MRPTNDTTGELPRQSHGVMAVMLALLWLWSNTLFAAWCADVNNHWQYLEPDQASQYATDSIEHHQNVCLNAAANPPLMVASKKTPCDDEDSRSPGLSAVTATDVKLPQGFAVAVLQVHPQSSTIPAPPLYLLYQKLLLPFMA